MGICSLPSEQCAATTWVCFKRYIDKGQVRTTASRLHSPVGPRLTRTRTRNLTRTPTRPRSPYFQGSRSIPILVYGNVYRFAVYAYDSGPNKKQMVWISALPLPTPMVRSNTPPRPLRGGSQDGGKGSSCCVHLIGRPPTRPSGATLSPPAADRHSRCSDSAGD